MLLLKGDYDDMLPQPSPAPRVGQSPPPPSPTCEQLHNNIRAWHKLYGISMYYNIAAWRHNVCISVVNKNNIISIYSTKQLCYTLAC